MHLIKAVARRRRNEDGNIMLSILIISVSTLVLLAALQSVVGGFDLVRSDQERTNAFQYANAGIDEALYRIDSGDMPLTPQNSNSYVPTVENGEVTGFTETMTLDGSTYDVVVAQDPPGQNTVWSVRSTGTDPSGKRRQAIATIEAQRLFENGFFTVEEFTLNGNQLNTAPVAYRSSTCPQAYTSCELAWPVPGRLGTNGIFDGSIAMFEALKEQWSGFNMYGRATQAAADEACGEGACGTAPTVAAITDRLEINVPEPPATVTPCPSGGTIGVSGTTTSIAPGDYACSSLNLQGVIEVSGTGDARFWVDGPISVADGAIINQQQRPRRFQLFQDDTPGGGSICGSEIWSLMYTPGLTIDCVGEHQPIIYGAVVANLHQGDGNHFRFHWDFDSRDVVNTGKYVVKNWRECPADTDDC